MLEDVGSGSETFFHSGDNPEGLMSKDHQGSRKFIAK